MRSWATFISTAQAHSKRWSHLQWQTAPSMAYAGAQPLTRSSSGSPTENRIYTLTKDSAGWAHWKLSTSSLGLKRILNSTFQLPFICHTPFHFIRKDQPTIQRKMNFSWGRIRSNLQNRSFRLKGLTNTADKMKKPTPKSSTSSKVSTPTLKRSKMPVNPFGRSKNTRRRNRSTLQLTNSHNLNPSTMTAQPTLNNSNFYRH